MKTRETTPRKTYAVTSPNGCTVTTDDGLTLAEIEAGKQGYFVAVSGKVLLSDEAAVLTQVFKLAPYQKLRLLGVVGGGVPAWFKALETELTALLDGSKFELAWIAGEKKLVVHTDRVSDELSDAVTALLERVLPQNVEVVRYNHDMEISWQTMAKYAECKNGEQLLATDTEWRKELCTGVMGENAYPYANEGWYDFPSLEEAVYFWTSYNDKPSISPQQTTRFAPYIMHINWPNCTFANQVFQGGAGTIKTRELYGNLDSLKSANSFFAHVGTVEVFDIALPSLEQGKSMILQCKINKKSALKILNSIPAYTSGKHELGISIHVDHKTDDEVLAAIANAESKGWTLTVQWNGTPTAQASVTYGLRRPPIYAKVGEIERPDGTTERVLDWGHYVTDTTGYEEFRSVEAAREYFGLPDEDLT